MIVYAVNPRFADAEDEEEYQAARNKSNPPSNTEVESSDKVSFQPPLYIQRYAKVVEICQTHQFKRVADVGCAELTFVQYLKNLDFVNQIFAVDMDRDLLNTHKHRCKPLMFEYLNPRPEPLNITVLCGSALEYDAQLADLDFISCIELIEHLPVANVQPFSENIFNRLRPRHVVISTPNSDFNVLFDFKPGQMRHWDHRFEWSQEEFKEYCEGVRTAYQYEYELFGVGNPPADQGSLGCCSQFALFKRTTSDLPRADGTEKELENGADGHGEVLEEGADSKTAGVNPYEVLYTIDYPVLDASITPDDKLSNEICYVCRMVGLDDYELEGSDTSHILISHLQTFPSIKQFEASDEHVAELAGLCSELTLSEDRTSIQIENIPPSPEPVSEEEEEDYCWQPREEGEEYCCWQPTEELW